MAYNSKYTGQQVEEILDNAVTATDDGEGEVPDTPSGGAVTSVNGQTGAVVITIPTKVSQLQNDSNFLTEHQSLKGLATTSYVNGLVGNVESLLEALL